LSTGVTLKKSNIRRANETFRTADKISTDKARLDEDVVKMRTEKIGKKEKLERLIFSGGHSSQKQSCTKKN